MNITESKEQNNFLETNPKQMKIYDLLDKGSKIPFKEVQILIHKDDRQSNKNQKKW